ncbi:hypothetical protein ACP4OV_001976 [Aristida adscensionis]
MSVTMSSMFRGGVSSNRARMTTGAGARLSMVVARSKPYYPLDAFIFHSGACYHVARNLKLFDPESFVAYADVLQVGGDSLRVEGRGSVIFGSTTLPEVLYVPGLAAGVGNMVSVSQLVAMDYRVEFCRGGQVLVRESLAGAGEVVGRGTRVDGGLYMVDYLRVPLPRASLPDYDAFDAAMISSFI